MSAEQAGVRADSWLWAARFFKTRALARQVIEHGHLEVNGGTCKPSRPLHVGDRLRIRRGEECLEVEVLGMSAKRGSVAVAQALYRESESSRLAREAAREQRRAERAGYQAPSGKPDKRARRLIRALGDIDSL